MKIENLEDKNMLMEDKLADIHKMCDDLVKDVEAK